MRLHGESRSPARSGSWPLAQAVPWNAGGIFFLWVTTSSLEVFWGRCKSNGTSGKREGAAAPGTLFLPLTTGQGLRGLQGPPGKMGPPGHPGPAGALGPKGSKGDRGDSSGKELTPAQCGPRGPGALRARWEAPLSLQPIGRCLKMPDCSRPSTPVPPSVPPECRLPNPAVPSPGLCGRRAPALPQRTRSACVSRPGGNGRCPLRPRLCVYCQKSGMKTVGFLGLLNRGEHRGNLVQGQRM